MTTHSAMNRSLFLVKPGSVSKRDIKRAEECGVTIIECAEPESARFLEAPPSVEIDAQAAAALSVVRQVIRGEKSNYYRSDIGQMLLRIIFDSSRPEEVGRVPK